MDQNTNGEKPCREAGFPTPMNKVIPSPNQKGQPPSNKTPVKPSAPAPSNQGGGQSQGGSAPKK